MIFGNADFTQSAGGIAYPPSAEGGARIWSIEHCRGGLSGLKRMSLVP